MGTGIGRGLLEIASLLIGVSMVSLFILNAQGTATIITAGGSSFEKLLRAATGR